MEISDIEGITKSYWDESEPSHMDEALRYYVCEKQERLGDKSLLEAELEEARAQENITNQPCHTLVLLVGFSLEPLLQSVVALQPKTIVLLLNQDGYAGEEWTDFAGHVTEAIQHLSKEHLLSQCPQFPGKDNHAGYPTGDTPSAVFQTLVEVLHDVTDVVIDVTGGKKSMVSGAYLYAAFAGVRISYVDFSKYDPKKRRPYGYSCKIDGLTNPYQDFALRDWERVRSLYNRYQFREAQKVLESIKPAMQTIMPNSVGALECMTAFLEYYEKWDSGDYRGSLRVAESMPNFGQPGAVTVLGDQWFEISGNDFVQKPQRFYGNLTALKAYVCDELARIERIIKYNEDFRSAFLRAGGVNEIVMLARLVALITDETDRNALLNALQAKTPLASYVFKALLKEPGVITINSGKRDISFTGAPTLAVSHTKPMDHWWEVTSLFNSDTGWKDFLDRRNDLIHTYLSVPREWAEDALRFVEANFENFLGHPMAQLGRCTEALCWSNLCKLCNLSRFLPPSLR